MIVGISRAAQSLTQKLAWFFVIYLRELLAQVIFRSLSVVRLGAYDPNLIKIAGDCSTRWGEVNYANHLSLSGLVDERDGMAKFPSSHEATKGISVSLRHSSETRGDLRESPRAKLRLGYIAFGRTSKLT